MKKTTLLALLLIGFSQFCHGQFILENIEKQNIYPNPDILSDWTVNGGAILDQDHSINSLRLTQIDSDDKQSAVRTISGLEPNTDYQLTLDMYHYGWQHFIVKVNTAESGYEDYRAIQNGSIREKWTPEIISFKTGVDETQVSLSMFSNTNGVEGQYFVIRNVNLKEFINVNDFEDFNNSIVGYRDGVMDDDVIKIHSKNAYFNDSKTNLETNNTQVALEKVSSKLDKLLRAIPYTYVFSVEGEEILATSTDVGYPDITSNDLSDIIDEIQSTRIDPKKNVPGNHSVTMYFKNGRYNYTRGMTLSGGYPTNTEATKISISMIGESYIGTGFRLNKADTGEDHFTFTNGLRVNLENFTISALGGNGKALYFKGPSQTGGFSVRDSYINNIYTYHSTEGFSVVMENIFSVICPRIRVTNFEGSGIDIRNNSSTTNYGNSWFGKLDVVASGNDGTTGFKVSTLENSNKLMNLLNINYLELGTIPGEGGGSNATGIHIENSANISIGLLVSEYLGRNAYLENSANITITNSLFTIERSNNQGVGEAFGFRLDNCSNVKILNGIYYTRDYTAAPVIANDDPYKGGNYIAGELTNGFQTSLIQYSIENKTELHFHQNGNPTDLLDIYPNGRR